MLSERSEQAFLVVQMAWSFHTTSVKIVCSKEVIKGCTIQKMKKLSWQGYSTILRNLQDCAITCCIVSTLNFSKQKQCHRCVVTVQEPSSLVSSF